jgi:hypothetical protein
MKNVIAHALAALALTLPGATAAQDRSTDQEMAAVAAQLVEKLGFLGDSMGLEGPALPLEALTSALGGALPMLPAGDGRDWNSSFAFDFKTDVTTGALEADEEGRVVLTDARACLGADEVGEVVDFTRFTRGPVRGHRCTITREVDGASVLQSRTFAQGPDRRLTAYYGVATIVKDDPVEARRLLEARLDQNVALAGTLADYALEMFLKTQAGTTDGEEVFAVRVERLTGRLAEIARSFETPAP